VRREDVDDDRERRRHDERAGGAHDRTAGDDLPHLGGERRQAGTDEEEHETELERALAPEAVAERAGREEQTGEDERIDGDDPLQLGLGRVQLARQGGDRDVEARVADEDDQEAQAQHREREPAPIVAGLDGRRGLEEHGLSGGRGRAEVEVRFRIRSIIGIMIPLVPGFSNRRVVWSVR